MSSYDSRSLIEQAKFIKSKTEQGWSFRELYDKSFTKKIGGLEIEISQPSGSPNHSWTLSGPGFERTFGTLESAFLAASEIEEELES